MKLNPYLNFGGNCRQAFRFYEKNLGGKLVTVMTHGEMPQSPGYREELKDTILYARLQLGDTYIMGSDVTPERFQPMRSVYMTLAVDSNEEAERVHALLAEGGEIFMPMQETFFAHRFSMLRDRFGTSWMLLHDKPAGA